MSTYVSLGDPEAERAPDGTILDIAVSPGTGAVRIGVYPPSQPPDACVHLSVYGAKKIAQRILLAAEWAEAGTVRPPGESVDTQRLYAPPVNLSAPRPPAPTCVPCALCGNPHIQVTAYCSRCSAVAP